MSKSLAVSVLSVALVPLARAEPLPEPLLAHDVFAPPDRRLNLVYVDVQQAAPFAFTGLAGEVATIFRREDVSVCWRFGGRGVVASDRELTIILLNSTGEGTGVAAHAMGAIRPASLRTVWIYVPNVAWSLGLDLGRQAAWSASDRLHLSLALGRVVAHELMHILSPELPHAARGLMAQQIGRAELLEEKAEISDEFLRALRPALVRRAAALKDLDG